MTSASGKPDRHPPYNISTNVSELPQGDRQAIPYILDACNTVDELFRRMTNQKSTTADFVYDRSRGLRAYDGLTKANIDAYLADHEGERLKILGELSNVVDLGDKLTTMPYVTAYPDQCGHIASELRIAASLVSDSALRNFLRKSASAFENDDHDSADVAWLDVGRELGTSTLEVNIGFHECGTDTLYNIKRDVQAIVGVINKGATVQFRSVQARMQSLDAVLGKRYGYAPSNSNTNLVAIDQLKNGGTALYDFIPAAYVLPNSPAFRRAHGAKQVFCLDVIRARLELVTKPIGIKVLPVEYRDALNESLLRQFIARHECGHNTDFAFRGETFGALANSIEECRADTVGVYSALIEARGDADREKEAALIAIIHLVDGLRRIRFGINEAHAVGTLIGYNWLIACGALRFRNSGMDFEAMHFLPAFETLCDELASLSMSGNTNALAEFVKTWGRVPDEIARLVEQFQDLPQDLDPQFHILGLG